ncbi:hypothetical protein HY345_01480 [Candidatus Microgenomates bacterium]|nr:hypothetical protein [Candidatus Microgenomates bacterium]
MVMVLLFLLAFIIRIIVAANTFGTWDMESVYIVADMLKKDIPVYLATWRYNQPPVWMWTIGGMSYLSDITNIPLSFWARIPFIFTDTGIGILIYKIAKWKKYQEKTAKILSALYLFSPIAIWVSSYQAQLDSAIIFLIILAGWILVRSEKITTHKLIISGLILGFSSTIKLVPLSMAPIFSWYLLKKMLVKKVPVLKIVISLTVFNLLLVIPLILVFLPYLDQWAGIRADVVGYKTAWGIWGTSLLLRRLVELVPGQIITDVVEFSKQQGLIVASILALSYLFVLIKRMSLFGMIFTLFFVVTLVSPFLAPQYLLWLLPFWLIEKAKPTLFIIYNLLSFSSLFLLFAEWQDPQFFVYLGNILGINDRILSINSFTLFSLSAWMILFFVIKAKRKT